MSDPLASGATSRKTDFLLELRSEEIPARMQAGARADLEKLFRAQMDAAGLSADSVQVWSTPRRLALIARGLPMETAAVSEERKGPRADAPAQALEGFLRSTGLTREQLVERDVKGTPTLFAVIEKPGRATRDVLAEAIPAIIRAFPWPKSMRWGCASQTTESLRWVRPLSGIVALLGDDLVKCEIDGIVSGCETRGHRFHHQGAVTIGNAGDYAVKLRAAHVIVDHEERQALIRDGAAKAAADTGLTLVADEGLVIENAGLTEWPVPLLGRFDAAFLEVPQEVIQLTARVNQKYFVCHDGTGALANAFVCTANIAASDGGTAIVAGNEKVLAARLSDARFFWEQDQKKTLEEHAEKLKNIVFHEKLGTVADKVERVAKLARWLVEEGIVNPSSPLPFRGGAGGGVSPFGAAFADRPHPNPSPEGEGLTVGHLADLAEQAARLCKADLVTEMVGEFPELQGLMGGYYAAKEGLDPDVAAAIRDHYKPVGQGDDVPTAPVTVAVSLADKLDTLFSFFAIEQFPTGSKDPFALRRAGLGYLRLIQTNSLKLELSWAAMAWSGDALSGVLGLVLADFLFDRLGVQLRDDGVKHDYVQASRKWVDGNDTDGRLDRVESRARALALFLQNPDGVNLLAAYKRAAKILPDRAQFASQLDSATPHDRALHSALEAAEPRAATAIAAEDFAAAMTALASLRAPIDAFFDGVMVNDPDPAVRAYRLGLLSRFRDAVHQVADFSKIEG